jgi:starch phosphorylase
MRSTIALNGSFFNSQRMISQYVANAYFPEKKHSSYKMFSAGQKAS